MSYFYKGVLGMKGSVETIRDRIYELSLRIDKETYNPSGSKSEIKNYLNKNLNWRNN